LRSSWWRGQYLFHVHTPYTDGHLTAAEYVEYAEKAGAETVVFLEHIRRQPQYDVVCFSEEVRLAGEGKAVQTVLGFEAKLLPDGALDISDEHLSTARVIGIAEHGFPDNPGLLLEVFRQVVETYPSRWPKINFVWVHPGLWYVKRRLAFDQDVSYRAMLDAALDAGILIERSLRWGVLSPAMAAVLPAESVVVGVDAHNRRDLERWAIESH
jgi:histidinol phosphatase-like PHP family hydrolase